MPWQGTLVGLMHTNKVTQKELARELNKTPVWVNLVLNEKAETKNAEQEFKAAYQRILGRRANDFRRNSEIG